MKTFVTCGAFFVLAWLVAETSHAQNNAALLPPVDAGVLDQAVDGKDKAKQPDKEKKKLPEKKPVDPPRFDVFAPTLAQESGFPTYFNPQMMGQYYTVYARQLRNVLGTQTTTTTTTTFNNPPGTTTTNTVATANPVAQLRQVLAAAPSRGGFNIAENESPMPQDRVFFTYNFFDNVGFAQSGVNAPLTTTTTTGPIINRNLNTQTTTTVTTVIPGAPRVDLHRETIGFEKTFLGGYASIELRAPLLQQGGGGIGIDTHNIGDLTIVTKYALYLDRAAGNVLSTGLAVTVPTGRGIETIDGTFRDTLLQPWIGYVWNFDRLYIQGFHSVVVPTDKRDVTLAFNDIGVNYWLYRAGPERLLRFVVPMAEVHVVTPLNHRGLDGPIVVPDTVIFTNGFHLGLGRSTTLSFGAAIPLTGPRPYNVEGFMQLNWRF